MSQYEPLYNSFDRSVPDRYVPADRLSVSPSAYLPGSEWDFQKGQLKPDHLRRRRTQAKRLEQAELAREEQERTASLKREMDKGGVRIAMRSGILIIALAVFAGCITVLLQNAFIQDRYEAIKNMRTDINACLAQNTAIEEQIAEACSYNKIGWAAVNELGMVHVSSAQAIYLEAVDTRPLEADSHQTRPVQPEVQTLTVQSTQIPMTASN